MAVLSTHARGLAPVSTEPKGQAEAELGRADALHAAGHLVEAAAAYRRALALDDGLLGAWYGLGCVELARGSFAAAASAFAGTLELRPAWAEVQHNLGKALFEVGEIEAAVAQFEAAARQPNRAVREAALEAIACIIPGSPAAGHADVLLARHSWAALVEPPPRGRPAARPRARSDKLRIGYLSSFFGRRNWMKPVIGVVNHHDRTRFEVHLFCDGALPGADTGYRDHPLDTIHSVGAAPNDKLAAYIGAAGIDVLVDLNGYSVPRRLGAIMHRPAPVILGWFNFYATSGIAAFDGIIGDAAVVAPGEEQFYSERVLRVPGSYLAFSVDYAVPEIAPPPCLGAAGLTFGCLASQYKITGEIVATWCDILHRAPAARLLIKNATLADQSTRAALHARFAQAGIAADRVELDGPDEHFAFLAAYGRVDIALDTFPYNGGTTTMEALWQGVPVLTFVGDRWASRTSCSLLRAAGLGDWCVTDRAAYIERAIAAANSPDCADELARLRNGMRHRLATSRVRDSRRLCRSLERLYCAVDAVNRTPVNRTPVNRTPVSRKPGRSPRNPRP